MSEAATRDVLDVASPPSTALTRPAHRPSGYTQEIADKICDAVAEGVLTRDIPKLPGFPGRSTFFRWMAEHADFAREYAYAKDWRTECYADEIIEIADDKSVDFKDEPQRDGNAAPIRVPDKEGLGRSELRIKWRIWRMAKEMPRKYGMQNSDAGGDNAPLDEPAWKPNPELAKLVGGAMPPIDPNDPLAQALAAYERPTPVPKGAE